MEFAYQSKPGALRAALPAAVLTLAIFIGLPLIEFLSSKQHGDHDLYAFETLDVPLTPPPEPSVKKPEALRREVPEPQLVRPRPRVPVQAVLGLDLSVGRLEGDFEMSFDIAAPALVDAGSYVFEISELDQAPQPIARIGPPYPPRARMRGLEGRVELEFVVARDGSVRNVEVTSASPQGIFDQAALRTVRQWRFKPGMKSGEAVDVRVRQTIKFALEE